MKKIISLVLVVSLLFTMLFTSSFTVNADNVVKTTVIDLTQDVANLFTTTDKTTGTTATVEDGKLKIGISAYERHLTSYSYGEVTWFPNYLLTVDSSVLKLTLGAKAIVEVKYKVVSANENAAWGAQIGIGNFDGGKGSNIDVRTSKKHTSADNGKEFILTSTFNVDGKYATKIAFAGGGTIEISSIVVHELPNQNVSDYAVVKYVDGSDYSTEFAKKNAAPKTPANDGRKFEGWFASSDFSGEPVTTITGDTTLYGRFTYRTTQIDLTQDITEFDLFANPTSGSYSNIVVEGDKLKVMASYHNNRLTNNYSYETQTWNPNYFLTVNGEMLSLTNGNEVIVEVNYKIVEGVNANNGVQIGIGNFTSRGTNVYMRTYNNHTTADYGKEFTLTSNFTADSKNAVKVVFSGGGTIEISSIVVHELPAQFIDEYAVVSYVDGIDKSTEFVKKGSSLKELNAQGNTFEGWYLDDIYSGEEVTSATADTTLYAKWAIDKNITTTQIDLTQDITEFDLFANPTSGSYSNIAVEADKLKVLASYHNNRLTNNYSYETQTWNPNYFLTVNGEMLSLTNGNEVIVEVKYKVVDSVNANNGVQIGIGNFTSRGTNVYMRTYNNHTTADQGKEFTLTSNFTADSKNAVKVVFSGGGSIEISSIVVHELPAQFIDKYAVVSYVDGTDETIGFVKKNTATKTPNNDGRKFEGWFASSDFSGEQVTTITEDVTLYGRFTYKTTEIDLTQDVTTIFTRTAGNGSATPTVENGKLKVDISSYDKHLTAQSYGVKTWFPNYLLAADGSTFKLTKGNKAIVEVKYKVVEANANSDWGVQIAIGNFTAGYNNSIYVRNYKKHTSADKGKEFTIASAFTVDDNIAAKIAFAGGGTIEISSIVVHELPAQFIDEYAVVKYVEGAEETTEFALKNVAPRAPKVDKDNFAAWNTSSDFTGTAVTTITGDATLYAKPILVKNIIDLTQDTAKAFANTGNTTATTAKVEDGKLKVTVSAYERQLSNSSFGTLTYFPNYLLTENGSVIKIANGDKAIVEVKYKVINDPNVTHGTQIGVGSFQGTTTGSNIYVRNSVKHVAKDKGKEFTLTSTFVADNKYATKIAFSGGGLIEISSIVLYELDSQFIDDYAVVKYIDNYNEDNEFVKKGTAPKTPSKETDMFAGWCASSDFSGETVTEITEDVTLYAKRVLVKHNIDLTQDLTNVFTTSGGDNSTATPTVEDGKLKVQVASYGHKLEGSSYSNTTWLPNYLLTIKGSLLKLTEGNKAIVEVKYKLLSIPNANRGISVGIGNYRSLESGSNINVRTYKKHIAGDQGKEFTLTSTFDVDDKYATKIAFAGGGKIEISSIVVYELNAQYADEYAIVKCVDGDNSVTEYAKKNTKLVAKLPNTLGKNFGGWYNGEEKVTTITQDVTATAKWHERFDANMDALTDVRDLVYIGEAYDGLNNDLLCDVDRDKVISVTDTVTLQKKLLNVEYVTIGGNEVSDYTLKTEEQPSFITNASTKLFADSFKETYGADLNANAENSIVVGILNTDEGVKTTAKENLTGVRGDVYGLDDYKIFFYEDDLYIEAGSDYATAFAVNTFKDIVNENKIFPKGLEIVGKYYGENNLFEGYSYVWGDEFNADKLDTSKWSVITGEKPGPYYEDNIGDNYYWNSISSGTKYGGPWINPEDNPNMQEGVITLLNEEGNNYYLQDGLLVMNTKKTETGYSATQINAKHSFTYGIMTARVKIATKNGACSTLWSRTEDDGGASVNEMDFIENFGADQIMPNLHTWVNYSDHTNHKGDIDKQDTITPAVGESLSDSFHEISLYWDEEKIVFYFDGVPYLEQDIASDREKWEAFHKSTYMIMGLGAPSGYYSTAAGGKNPGDYMGELINSFSENYEIDYIRVFQK